MITPAFILAGAIVPMAFVATVPVKSEIESESCQSTTSLHFLSLLCNITAAMWSVIAVNWLTETDNAPAESVWHLLRLDFDLPWYVS